jgi:hypothetical protein
VGTFVFNATGHLFLAIPCINSQGIPTADTTCSISQRRFDACTASGCHGSTAAAQSAFLVATARIQALNAMLKGQLAQVPKSELNASDSVYTVAEGATFNSKLAAMAGSVVHNPFLLEALLRGSIQAVQNQYGIAPAGVLPPASRWSAARR